MIRRVVAWLKWLAPLAVAFFIARVIYRQWQRVEEFDWRFDPLFLLLSFGATSCWFFARAHVWRTIVQRLGGAIPYRECVRIFALSELSRYVPGTVWQYLSRVYLASRWGVAAPAAVTASLLDLLLLALAAAPAVLWQIDKVFPVMRPAQRALLVVFPVAAVVLLQPALLDRLARWLLPRLRMEAAPIRLRFAELARLWAVYLLLWAVFGAGFALFARSLTPIGFSQGVTVALDYTASWLTALVTPFAPGGLVVREGVFGLLLGKILPIGTALLIAVLSRLWLVALELFWAAVAQACFRARR